MAGEALAALDAILADGEDAAPIHLARGCALRDLRRHPEAVLAFDAAIAADPTSVPAHLNRASALSDLGRDAEALTEALIAEAIRPDHPPALVAQGVFLRLLGQPGEALRPLERVLAAVPDHAVARLTKAACLSDLGRQAEAMAIADGLLGEDAERHRAIILHRMGRHVEAAAAMPCPTKAEGWNVRARALTELGRLEEALECLDRLGAEAGGNPNLPYNRGIALRGLNRHGEAIAAFAEARRLDPAFAEAEWNESLSRLALGDFAAGLPAYEARWRRRNHPGPRHAAAPVWRGEDLAGRTLLLHAEQGLGDTIQMVRYVPLAAARGARVVVEVQRPLLPLLRDLPGAAQVIATGDPVPPHDVQCPIMSLPLAFGTRRDTIPAAIPYVAADPARVAAWDRELPRGPLRLGLVCSGNPDHAADRERSVPLAAFAPLLGPGVAAFLVQTDLREADADVLAAEGRITPLRERLTSFTETAAVLSALDLVVAVDTSVAHLAGALGRPVHLLLPHLADWRWMLDRADSPWYPTMRLHRRGRGEGWGDVIARVAAEVLPARLAA
ncbi:tetratricopeptide repeat protein [Roseomonas sp. CCTCC AB2023176]|uniref:tetratricopeptide repeat protein n=1 Tax=Roseomonas sp. CCTCC AB2023176 TaxID=3342640 RepID=UPI0035D57F05